MLFSKNDWPNIHDHRYVMAKWVVFLVDSVKQLVSLFLPLPVEVSSWTFGVTLKRERLICLKLWTMSWLQYMLGHSFCRSRSWLALMVPVKWDGSQATQLICYFRTHFCCCVSLDTNFLVKLSWIPIHFNPIAMIKREMGRMLPTGGVGHTGLGRWVRNTETQRPPKIPPWSVLSLFLDTTVSGPFLNYWLWESYNKTRWEFRLGCMIPSIFYNQTLDSTTLFLHLSSAIYLQSQRTTSSSFPKLILSLKDLLPSSLFQVLHHLSTLRSEISTSLLILSSK